ncbi:MAG: hypothetical protein AAGC83_07530, partial [Pseudomonadota bacterium]
MASISDDQIDGSDVPTIRSVYTDKPWSWLGRGWADFKAAPTVSIVYGGFFAVIGAIIIYLAWTRGAYYLVFPLMAGFLLIG